MRRILILALVLVAGCATTEKKAKLYYLEHKDQLAKLCADCFPVQIKYTPGKDIYLPQDTVYIKGDSINVDCPDGTVVKVKGTRDTMKIYVPIMRIDTITRPDSAAIFYWKSEYQKSDKDKNELILKNASTEEDKGFWRKWALILGGVIVAYSGFRIYRVYRSLTELKKLKGGS